MRTLRLVVVVVIGLACATIVRADCLDDALDDAGPWLDLQDAGLAAAISDGDRDALLARTVTLTRLTEEEATAFWCDALRAGRDAEAARRTSEVLGRVDRRAALAEIAESVLESLARDALAGAVAALPESPHRELWSGRLLLAQDDDADAVAPLRAATTSHGRIAKEARSLLGPALVRLGRRDEALVVLRGLKARANADTWRTDPAAWRSLALGLRENATPSDLDAALAELHAPGDGGRDLACWRDVLRHRRGLPALEDPGCPDDAAMILADTDPWSALEDAMLGDAWMARPILLARLGFDRETREALEWSPCDSPDGWTWWCDDVAALRDRYGVAPLPPPRRGPRAPAARHPTPAPWSESAMPEALRRTPVPDGDDDDEATPCLAAETLPAPLRDDCIVRIERNGTEITAVSLSTLVDPVDETSGGGYWLHLSDDGGRTFAAPLCTGLVASVPYVACADSKLPIRDAGAIRLEVLVRDVDDSTITYPPVHLGFARLADDRVVETKLAELARDTDADGLTDVLEGKLLLDPRSPDTDGDGASDAIDPSPRSASTPRAEDGVLRAALEDWTSPLPPVAESPSGDAPPEASLPPVTSLGAGPAVTTESLQRLVVPKAVMFLETGDRSGVVLPGAVVISLTTDEARARNSPFHATRATILLSPTGDAAIVDLSEGWRGVKMVLRRQGDRWTITRTAPWIT